MDKEQSAIIIKQYTLILGWAVLSPFLVHMGYLMHNRFLKRKSQKPILITILITFTLTLIFSFIILITYSLFDSFDLYENAIGFFDYTIGFLGVVLFYTLGFLGVGLFVIYVELPLFSLTISTLIYLMPIILIYLMPIIFSIRYFKAEDYRPGIDFKEYKDYKRIDGYVHLYESKSTFLLVSNQGHILFYPIMKSIYIKDVIAIDIIIDEIIHNDVLSGLKEAFWNVSSSSVGPINIKKKIIHSITMNFALNDFNNPHIYFPIISEKTPINSLRFKNAQERLMQIIATLQVVKEKFSIENEN